MDSAGLGSQSVYRMGRLLAPVAGPREEPCAGLAWCLVSYAGLFTNPFATMG